jgi:hypothetical protein
MNALSLPFKGDEWTPAALRTDVSGIDDIHASRSEIGRISGDEPHVMHKRRRGNDRITPGPTAHSIASTARHHPTPRQQIRRLGEKDDFGRF